MSADFAARRARVLDRLAPDGALIIGAAPEPAAGDDDGLRYTPGADLYYLSGYVEPEAVLVLCPSADTPFTLFVRPRDPERERWTGVRGGVDSAVERHGADAGHPIAELGERLPKLVAAASVLYARIDSRREDMNAAVRAVLVAARSTRARTGRGVHTVIDPDLLLGPLRVRKDEHELELMREAARISVDAFGAAMRALRGAEGEWQLEATLESAFRMRGATPAYPSIVAAGASATVLHYHDNDAPLRPGELVLIDAGARYRMYCADITRTWPVGGRFSLEQRAIYDIVLAAHGAAIHAARTGQSVDVMHAASRAELIDGMRQLGLISGTQDEILESGSYKRYFPHRTSHWLGLDVHDAGDYADATGQPVPLEAGMVLTVEPGLYVPADDETAPAALRGIGIRLEDDVLITGAAPEILTGALPIRPDELEAVLSG